MNKNWVVYKHTNTKNGKCYIGITCEKRPANRWGRGSKYMTGTQPKFANAIKKYGWNSFTHEIIEKNILTLEDALKREQYYIETFDSYKNGYNMNNGGKGNLGHKVSEKQKIEHSKKMKGRKPWNLGIHSNIVPWNKGKKMSEEYCDKIRGEKNGMYGKKGILCPAYGKSYSNKPIVQLTKTGNYIREYNSIKEASKTVKVSTTSIKQVLYGKRITSAGYKWMFKERYTLSGIN